MKLKLLAIGLALASGFVHAATFDGAEAARQSKQWLEKKDPLSYEIARESQRGFEQDQRTIEARKKYDQRSKNDPEIFCIEIAILYTEIKLGYMDQSVYKTYHKQCVAEFKGRNK